MAGTPGRMAGNSPDHVGIEPGNLRAAQESSGESHGAPATRNSFSPKDGAARRRVRAFLSRSDVTIRCGAGAGGFTVRAYGGHGRNWWT